MGHYIILTIRIDFIDMNNYGILEDQVNRVHYNLGKTLIRGGGI